MRLKVIILFPLSFLLFVLFLLPLRTYSQFFKEIDNINADSLRSVLPELTGTEKIDTLNKIAFRIAKDYPDSSRKLANCIVSMSDSMNYQKGLADGYRNLGNSYLLIDSLFPAMINYLNAVRIYEQIDPSIELAGTYRTLSWMNTFTGRFNSTIKYERKAIKVFKQKKAIEEIEYRYQNIAFAYKELGEFDSAIFYNEIAMSFADSTSFHFCYNVFGRIYNSQFYESGDSPC